LVKALFEVSFRVFGFAQGIIEVLLDIVDGFGRAMEFSN
jgi:hypothetical protein